MTARAVWVGAINFGLVNINVKLYSATQDNDISFKQVHRHASGEIGSVKTKRVSSIDGEEVPYGEILKGYQTEDGIVILTGEEVKAIPLDSARVIEVQEFVDRSAVDDILLERTYTVTPEDTAVKAYSLLLGALAGSGRVGVVKVALRQREQLAMLTVRAGRLSLTTLRWADEVRAMPAPSYPAATEAEVAMASQLIESMVQPAFTPENHQDGYRVALEKLIESKRDGAVVVEARTEPQSGNVVDLMAALRASIEEARSTRLANEAKRKPRTTGRKKVSA